MKISEVTNPYQTSFKKKDHKPKPVARLWGGLNGTRVPDDLKSFVDKHIKKSKNGSRYINQYPDRWYEHVFADHPSITDFNSFLKVLKPYFSIQRKQEL